MLELLDGRHQLLDSLGSQDLSHQSVASGDVAGSLFAAQATTNWHIDGSGSFGSIRSKGGGQGSNALIQLGISRGSRSGIVGCGGCDCGKQSCVPWEGGGIVGHVGAAVFIGNSFQRLLLAKVTKQAVRRIPPLAAFKQRGTRHHQGIAEHWPFIGTPLPSNRRAIETSAKQILQHIVIGRQRRGNRCGRRDGCTEAEARGLLIIGLAIDHGDVLGSVGELEDD